MRALSYSRLLRCQSIHQQKRCYFFSDRGYGHGLGTIWAKSEGEAVAEAQRRWSNRSLLWREVTNAR